MNSIAIDILLKKCYNIFIRTLIRKGGIIMKIGIIVASEKERRPFFEVFGQPDMRHIGLNAYDVSLWKINSEKYVYLILGGVGEISSASSTQYLIDNFQVDKIINYGVVGGLTEECSAMKIGVVEKVVHYGFDISFGSNFKVGEYPKLGMFHAPILPAIPDSTIADFPKFTCASADIIVAGGEPKRRLRREFNADICEMEAAGIVLTCNRNRIPCTLIKAVSDGVDEDVEAFDRYVHDASKACVRLIAKLI